MIQYKFTLDKSSKKFICPRCNKKTFVKYIDTVTENYLNELSGRCDRESSCSYHSKPDGDNIKIFNIKNFTIPTTTFHNFDLVYNSGKSFNQNNFIQFLKTIFSETEVKCAIEKYLIGTSERWIGATIFWQIDNLNRIHAGKILQYKISTGKRIKDVNGKGLIDWVHSILKRQKKIFEFNFTQCLFGLHLITETNLKTIALVESEKTAIIMSIFKPEYIWLSTGGKSGLKYEFLKPLKEYNIVAFPDKSEYSDWFNKASQLVKFGFKIIVDDWLENQTEFEAGTDLADVLISLKEKLTSNKKLTYSDAENKIHDLEIKFPELRKLINTFDLRDEHSNEIRTKLN